MWLHNDDHPFPMHDGIFFVDAMELRGCIMMMSLEHRIYTTPMHDGILFVDAMELCGCIMMMSLEHGFHSTPKAC